MSIEAGKGVKMGIEVRMEREEIEVTRDGTLPPFKPDYTRKFVPGLTTFHVTVDGVELPPMSPEEYEKWQAEKA